MKIFKRLLFLLFTLFLLCIGGLAIVGIFYGDEIKNLVVANLNKSLTAEVQVSNVRFSVWENFPNASIVFSDVIIHSTSIVNDTNVNDTLLVAEKLSVKFNVFDIYKKNYKLTGLGISNGFCRMKVDKNGIENYIFWSTTENSSDAVSFQLQNVDLKNMLYSYIDYSKAIGVSFLLDEMRLNGNFVDRIFDLEATSTLLNANVQVGETGLLENRTLFISLNGKVNQNNSILTFESTNLGIDGMNINIAGDVHYGEKAGLNLNLNSSNTELEKAIALLPVKVKNNLNRFKISGSAKLNGTISGNFSSETAPFYQFDFTVKNGLFKDKKSDVRFSDIQLDGSITNGSERNLKSTKVVLNQFSTRLNEGKINGILSLEDFENPAYQFNGNVIFGLKEVLDFTENKELKNPTGLISSSITVSGRLATIDNYTLSDWKQSKIEGNVILKDISFGLKLRPQEIKKINGKLKFNNKDLEIKTLTGNVASSNFSLNGKFRNLIPYLIEKEEKLFVDATLNSSFINLAELLKTNEVASSGDQNFKLNISERLNIYLMLNVEQLSFNKFNLNNLSGNLVVKNQGIDARNISFKSQEGEVSGDFFVRSLGENLSIATAAQFKNVDIQKTFESFGNFGQNSLRAEHLKGVAQINLNLNSLWSKTLEINTKSIKADIDFVIADGELLNYQPLEALSAFVELEELKAIKFKQLQNHILIQNEIITIPRFNIYSSAINLSIAGTHRFNNTIDYHITLLLSEILGGKVKKPAENEFGYVVDDGLTKKMKLFLKMSGSVDDPKIAYDTKELKNTLSKRLDEEKNTVKSLLKEEFGLFKKDSSIKKIPEKSTSKSPFSIEIDSSYINKKHSSQPTKYKSDTSSVENETKKKSKFGKFLDKIAQPNDEEFVPPIEK